MTVSIVGRNAPELYQEGLQQLRVHGKVEKTRLGEALVIQEPVELWMEYPDERLLFDPVRKANPFFHAMEFVWMMAGSDNANWIAFYNSKMMDFADNGIINGAYGHRWRRHFGLDQIWYVINLLREDPETRRAVIAMWDPATDLNKGMHDYPCNTHITFRKGPHDALNMTVFNRSNDFIWGMLGANIIHMTMLHELIAHGAGLKLGRYNVLSNNVHIYRSLPNYEELMATWASPNPYYHGEPGAVLARAMFGPHEDWIKLISDCERAVTTSMGFHSVFESTWMRDVGVPIHFAYLDRVQKVGDGMRFVEQIKAPDWQLACRQWIKWKEIATPAEG